MPSSSPQKQEATRLGKEAGPGPGRNWAALLEPREAGRFPALAAVTSAVRLPGRPLALRLWAVPAPGGLRQVPGRPPPGVGTPFLLSRPSSASSVSPGKTVCSFGAPHPHLGNPLSCFRHPSPGVQRLHLRAFGSPRASRAPSPLQKAGESVSGRPKAAGLGAWACEVPGRSPQRGLSLRPGRAHPHRARTPNREARLGSRITPPT